MRISKTLPKMTCEIGIVTLILGRGWCMLLKYIYICNARKDSVEFSFCFLHMWTLAVRVENGSLSHRVDRQGQAWDSEARLLVPCSLLYSVAAEANTDLHTHTTIYTLSCLHCFFMHKSTYFLQAYTCSSQIAPKVEYFAHCRNTYILRWLHIQEYRSIT